MSNEEENTQNQEVIEFDTIRDFIKKLTGRLDNKWVSKNGYYYQYDGTCYRKVTEKYLKKLLYIKLGDKASSSRIKEIINLLKYELDEIKTPDEEYLCFKNGLLRLSNFELIKHSPDIFVTSCYDFYYDPSAECPNYRDFLNAIFQGDEELIKLDQEWTGLLLTKNTSFQKARFNVGAGANGKSVHTRMMKKVVGRDNYIEGELRNLWNERKVHKMENKKALFCEETSHFTKFRSGKFKESIDGYLHANPKYDDPYDFKNTAKVVLNTNTTPETNDSTRGLYRRLLIFPYKHLIDENDIERDYFEKHLKNEIPGIVNYALKGLERLREQGDFSDCNATEIALNKFKNETNPLRAFVTEQCKFKEDAYIEKDKLYEKYNTFCRNSGYSNGINKAQFAQKLYNYAKMNNRKVESKQKRLDQGRKRVFYGITLC